MGKVVPLDEQIVATLTQSCTSSAAAVVLANAEHALSELTRKANTADVASLSPLATGPQARDLRREAEDCRFDADRMEASVSALSARVADLEADERGAASAAAHAAAIAERDALAADIAEAYPRIVFELTSLAKRIEENDVLCAQRHIRESAEAIGRGCPSNFYASNGPVMRIRDIRIGMPASSHPAWDSSASSGWRWWGLTLETAPTVTLEIAPE